ncbi:hypothetical protein FH972_001120 [Carpinus fangiana]|uniref:Uncharacterized protein n=1 Tax=Carpinus fangiana TaxID=176857 RepID=A0A5N6QDW6_9ROSI|nr:hypothetical protein FH972_001120 [Carpinus fangiana]
MDRACPISSKHVEWSYILNNGKCTSTDPFPNSTSAKVYAKTFIKQGSSLYPIPIT